jgi:hypothetical protein
VSIEEALLALLAEELATEPVELMFHRLDFARHRLEPAPQILPFSGQIDNLLGRPAGGFSRVGMGVGAFQACRHFTKNPVSMRVCGHFSGSAKRFLMHPGSMPSSSSFSPVQSISRLAALDQSDTKRPDSSRLAQMQKPLRSQ